MLAACAIADPQNEIVVQMQPGVRGADLAAKYRVILLDETENAPFALFTFKKHANPTLVRNKLSKDPGVAWVEDNVGIGSGEGTGTKGTTLPAVGGRDDERAANTHVLQQIDWDAGLANQPGRVVRVAILDTGLSPLQSALWLRVDASENFVEKGLPAYDQPMNEDSNGNGIPDEEVGHGTMVASVVDQISPLTHLLIGRVTDSDGIATAWSVVEGLAFAVTHGAEIANLSVGSPIQIAALSDVAEWCKINGLLIVASAGNGNLDSLDYPARISSVVGVTGVDPNNRKASFSNYDGHAMAAAPATGIVGQWWDGHMGVWSGTSFAAPMVTATIADGLRLVPFAKTQAAIEDALAQSGKNIDTKNRKYRGKLGLLIDFRRFSAAIARGR